VCVCVCVCLCESVRTCITVRGHLSPSIEITPGLSVHRSPQSRLRTHTHTHTKTSAHITPDAHTWRKPHPVCLQSASSRHPKMSQCSEVYVPSMCPLPTTTTLSPSSIPTTHYLLPRYRSWSLCCFHGDTKPCTLKSALGRSRGATDNNIPLPRQTDTHTNSCVCGGYYSKVWQDVCVCVCVCVQARVSVFLWEVGVQTSAVCAKRLWRNRIT